MVSKWLSRLVKGMFILFIIILIIFVVFDWQRTIDIPELKGDEGYRFPFLAQDRDKISYADTWGAGRSFGGDRKHEGTDLMADKGIPVVSVSDGIIIRKGWNRLGGWTVTILDIKNPHLSFYYAHLNNYSEDIYPGKYIKAGELLGYVGDSGYGEEGTTGQFPPHLHFGLYMREHWLSLSSQAINPYPFLVRWKKNN